MAKPKTKFRRVPGLDALAVGVLLLLAVNLLPPDTSLRLIREAGALRVCVPRSFPPLVTGNAAEPGFDVSVLQEIAGRLQLKLQLNVITAIGRDFNPRNWRLTRADCQVVAGGVTTSLLTRSLLETISTGIENSWVAVGTEDKKLAAGSRVGVFPGFSGLDRAKLSAYLRGLGAEVTLAASPEDLGRGLAAGTFDVAITGTLDARPVLAAAPHLSISHLPDDLGRYDFGFGLWKGDLTLKRALAETYDQLEREGFVENQRARYGLTAPAETPR